MTISEWNQQCDGASNRFQEAGHWQAKRNFIVNRAISVNQGEQQNVALNEKVEIFTF
jgi:hypothetical protein